jgi:hypothetical protein
MKPLAAADSRSADPVERHSTRAPRRATLLPGLVTYERTGVPVPIRVTNMSASGASLVIVTTDRSPASVVAEMPNAISLFLTYDRFSVACEVKWRRGEKIGVRFVSVPKILDKPPVRSRTAPKKK